jgi:hypothetical protein
MCTSGSGVRCIGRVLHAFSLTHKKGRRTSTGENQPGRQTKQGVATSNDDRKSDILGIPIERHIQPDLQFALIRILYIQADLADERRMKKDRSLRLQFHEQSEQDLRADHHHCDQNQRLLEASAYAKSVMPSQHHISHLFTQVLEAFWR